MRTLISLAFLVAVAGCDSMAAHTKAREDTRRGGNIDQGMAAETARQKDLTKEKVALKDKELAVTREVQRMDQRIAAAKQQGDASDAELKLALDQRKISKAKYDELKTQQTALQADIASLQLKNATDQRKPSDPKVEAEKEKRLADLKARQKKLEDELALALKVQ